MDFLQQFKDKVKRIDDEPTPRQRAEAKAAAKRRHEEYIMKMNEVQGNLFSIHKRELVGGRDPRECANIPILMNLSEKEADHWKEKLKTVLVDEDKRIVRYYEKVRQDGHKSGVLDNEYPAGSVMIQRSKEPKVELIEGEVEHVETKPIEIERFGRYDEPNWQG